MIIKILRSGISDVYISGAPRGLIGNRRGGFLIIPTHCRNGRIIEEIIMSTFRLGYIKFPGAK